jgi:hypothetical protein
VNNVKESYFPDANAGEKQALSNASPSSSDDEAMDNNTVSSDMFQYYIITVSMTINVTLLACSF